MDNFLDVSKNEKQGGLSFSFSQPHRQGELMWYPLTPSSKKLKKFLQKNLKKNFKKKIFYTTI